MVEDRTFRVVPTVIMSGASEHASARGASHAEGHRQRFAEVVNPLHRHACGQSGRTRSSACGSIAASSMADVPGEQHATTQPLLARRLVRGPGPNRRPEAATRDAERGASWARVPPSSLQDRSPCDRLRLLPPDSGSLVRRGLGQNPGPIPSNSSQIWSKSSQLRSKQG